MPAFRWIIVATLAATALGLGCAEPRLEDDPHLDVATAGRCYDCHGDRANGNVAPPPMRLGDTESDTPDPHQVHLQGSEIHDGVACSDCHVVPADVYDEAHINDGGEGAELTWDGLATAHGAMPEYDAETRSCSDVYCHGATLRARPDDAVDPVWAEQQDGLDCGSCHGAPPAAPHTPATDCERCHSDVAGPGMTIANPALHVDGNLQVDDELPCDGCHGSDGDPAPPTDLAGNIETTFTGVGAHRAHTGASDWHAEVACESCHTVPESWPDSGHIDRARPADITWGGLAAHGGAEPNWNGESCSNAYCHGATVAGGEHPEPEWTLVDGSQAQCGSCHGAPPPAPHPAVEDCSLCHGDVVGPDGTITNAALHIDGTVQVEDDQPCDSCHGGDGDPAPPTDTRGNSETSFRGVGAHQVHVAGGDLHSGVECTDCHVVPEALTDEGHVDSELPAEVTFDGLAVALEGDEPSFDGTSCSNTYCHAGSPGGTHPEPEWTLVDGTQALCTSCHGAPPPTPHPANDDCALCHSDVVDSTRSIIDVELHVNGTIDVVASLACDTCHGSDANPAPPTGLDGELETSARAVGAHQAHLGSSDWHAQVECGQCHQVPAEFDAPGHIDDADGFAELTWGRLAKWGWADPSFDGTSCSNTYCHGGGFPERHAGSHTSPVWTEVDGSQTTCGSCHGDPPGGSHPAVADCSVCHAAVIDSSRNFVNPALHINGFVNVDVDVP